MKPLKALPNKFVPLIRYKCTCGHCEDLKEDRTFPQNPKGRQVLTVEGFQEIP
jgi:hypothetical protein